MVIRFRRTDPKNGAVTTSSIVLESSVVKVRNGRIPGDDGETVATIYSNGIYNELWKTWWDEVEFGS